MATTNAEKITALETALASGELTVEYDDFKATYRSTDQLIKAIAYFKGLERAAAGGRTNMQPSYGAFYRE